ncbi:oxygen-dependent protoporphyrinogen oxidase [Sporothrix bragantina]|uniref:Oxygen-dependent protoporphyrinogen oxidase n=1 Tax=Sporothrix bragantina TaxID=671064 RepID=A0ABP0B5H9_9PEZI
MGPRRGVCAVAARTALARRAVLNTWSARYCAVVACRGSRGFSSSSAALAPQPRVPSKVAVIGGGLTGLATAHYLAMLLPASSQIVVYEGSGRTGGWIDSGKVKQDDTAEKTEKAEEKTTATTVPETFESGARMVAPQSRMARFDDYLLLELIDQLDLVDELRVSGLKADQYIYYPDHLVNVSLFNGKPKLEDFGQGAQRWQYYTALVSWAIQCFLHIQREPAFQGFWNTGWGFLKPTAERERDTHKRFLMACIAPGRMPPASCDESVGAYIMRRTNGQGLPLVNNMVSALMHGIYGGDVWKLSIASSVFRNGWLAESVVPVFKLFARQIKIAEMRKERAEALGGAGARPTDHPDFPGQNEGLGGGIAGFAPLSQETVDIAKEYGRSRGRKAITMKSDMDLLRDIMLRMHARHEHWQNRTKNMPADKRGRSPADGLGTLGVASGSWTQFGFDKGFGTLTDALTRSLRSRPNVHIRTGQPVTAIKYADQRVGVVTGQTKATDGEWFDRVIATVASPTLFRLTGGSPSKGGLLPALRHEHAVTIMVVNLYYAEPALHHPYRGFGYLIPQSVPLEQNPEGALGVIFDSDRELDTRPVWDIERYSQPPIPTSDTAERMRRLGDYNKRRSEHVAARDEATYKRGSKYTVMLGGHYWDGYGPEDYPTPEQAVEMAEAVLQRHLRDAPGFSGDNETNKKPRPVATNAKLCRECIPQHYVGHSQRMNAAHDDLVRSFGGKLAVAGGSYTAVGPGVLASVRSAYDVALRVAGRGYRTNMISNGRNETDMDHVGDTGLGRFADPATDGVIPVVQRHLPGRFGNPLHYEEGRWYYDGALTETEKN